MHLLEAPRPLLIWCLNGEGFAGRTAAEIPPTVQWLQSLAQTPAALRDTTLPDVLCLQDFRLSMIPCLGPLPYFVFVPMTNHLYWGKREPLGICIASRWPIDDIAIHHCWGDGVVRDLEGVGEDHARIQPYALADELVLKTQNRVAVACSVARPGDPRPLPSRSNARGPSAASSPNKVGSMVDSSTPPISTPTKKAECSPSISKAAPTIFYRRRFQPLSPHIIRWPD